MQFLYGPALLCAVVLAVIALRPKASGAVSIVLPYPAMEEIAALVLTVAAAFGILLTSAGFTSLY